MPRTVFTIGHSTHTAEYFLSLLARHGITTLADVRSVPYSRTNPQFNRENLQAFLRDRQIAYVYLGRELGARSPDPACYQNGRVQYDRLAATDLFRQGLERVRRGLEQYRIVLMCAEKEPLSCHRTILVARRLADFGLEIEHIHADGSLESHPAAMARLKTMLGLPESDMFRSSQDLAEEAYRLQGDRMAYQIPLKSPHRRKAATAESEPQP